MIHNWVGKVVLWELCKKLKFDNYEHMVCAQHRISPGKWDSKTLLGFWDTDGSSNIGQTIRPYTNKKRKLAELWSLLSQRTWVKFKKCKKKNKCFNLGRELKKSVEHESDDYTNWNLCCWNTHKKIGTRREWLINNAMGYDCLNNSIVEIAKNHEKSPRDLKSLAIIQTPVENHQLT